MNKNLLWKLVLIVAILLVFLFGIFGIPQSFSGQGLLAAMTKPHSPWAGFARRNPPDPAGAGE